MKTKMLALIGAALIPVLTCCAATSITTATVGPKTTPPDAGSGCGYLQVFSDTETHPFGHSVYYYPHTSYNIHYTASSKVKWVANHVGDMDETPSLVALPAGNYQVVAESASYGRITVPVKIVEGEKTTVHLDRDWKSAANNSGANVVRLPDGEAIGWSN